ncbi:MAG: hypothetical protein J2P19_01055 [Pseudonocardia sp.]|nr:hypothetical protein [Pseudonocardia sp.]
MGDQAAFVAAVITARVPHILAVPSPGAGKPPPGASKFLTVLSWGAWIASGLLVAAAITAGVKMALAHHQHRGGGEESKNLAWVIAGCIVVAIAAPLVTALLK